MKVFISHKQEDAVTANQIANELDSIHVDYYLDLLDPTVTKSGKMLTEHIRKNLNTCTDIIVIMSEITRYSQWVPFEVGMAAQVELPTATFLKDSVLLPNFLQYWPRLKRPSDIRKYVSVRKEVDQEYRNYRSIFENSAYQKTKTERFYDVLKQQL